MTARTRRQLNVEDLLGLPVRDRHGDLVGHIEEIRAHAAHHRYVVDAFLLGSGALWRRLSVLRKLLARGRTIVVRWDQLDMSNVRQLRLRCPREELAIEE